MGAAVIIEQQYQIQGMEMENQAVASLLGKRDEATFEQVFKSHFKRLHAYAFTILQNEVEAEETVQQVFFKLWERNETLTVNGSITAYLYRAVHNESLNFIKHQKVKSTHQLHIAYRMKNDVEQPGKKVIAKELEKKIQEALNELPEQCRTVFQMSRFDEMKYREVAEKLGISVKTVENQMGKALKFMRAKLVDFLTYILFFINF